MRAAYPAPVHTKLGSILDSRCLGNVCYTLSEVELYIFLGIDSLNFNEGSVIVLIAQAAFVSQNGTVAVETCGLGVLLRHSFNIVSLTDQ